jgi:integrase
VSFRHSFVSLLSDAAVPIEDVSRLVGPSSTSVTELVYRHQIRPVIQSGAMIMDRLFGSPADRRGAKTVAADGIKSPRR